MSKNLVKKIAPKTVMNDEIKNFLDGNKHVKLFSVFGRTVGFKTGTSTYGAWVKFMGDFVAVNLQTGEEVASSACHLPEPAQSMIHSALTENESVDFALEIGLKPSKAAIGYEYTVTPLVQAKESDALAHLRGVVQASLPAPAKKGK